MFDFADPVVHPLEDSESGLALGLSVSGEHVPITKAHCREFLMARRLVRFQLRLRACEESLRKGCFERLVSRQQEQYDAPSDEIEIAHEKTRCVYLALDKPSIPPANAASAPTHKFRNARRRFGRRLIRPQSGNDVAKSRCRRTSLTLPCLVEISGCQSNPRLDTSVILAVDETPRDREHSRCERVDAGITIQFPQRGRRGSDLESADRRVRGIDPVPLHVPSAIQRDEIHKNRNEPYFANVPPASVEPKFVAVGTRNAGRDAVSRVATADLNSHRPAE